LVAADPDPSSPSEWQPLPETSFADPTPIDPAADPATEPSPLSTAQIQAEIRELRQEVIQMLMRIEALEAQVARQTVSDRPVVEPSTAAEIAPLPTLDPATLQQLTPSQDPTPSDPTLSDATPSEAAASLQSPAPEQSTTSATDGGITSKAQPQVTPTPLQVGSQTISLPGDVLFDFDQATIRPEAATMLKQVADSLGQMPSARIHVAGHTDNIGADNYNLSLSLARANAVKDYLIKLIPPDKPFSWSTTGFGSSQPKAENKTEAGRQQNRRVDLIIAP
jgi:peptidoglycan-associated lipoprotein